MKKNTLLQRAKADIGLGAAIVLVSILYLFLLLSCWGVIPGAVARNVAFAPTYWHLIGFVLTGAATLWTWLTLNQSRYVTKNETANAIIAVLLMIVSICSYSGFFTDHRAGF